MEKLPTHGQGLKLSSIAQIEALLRRINEENKKTKEVLETIQRNELRKELKVIRKLAISPKQERN